MQEQKIYRLFQQLAPTLILELLFKTKGMIEKEIINIGFDSTNIFQPGHLRGNNHRFDILFADIVSIFLDPFLFGPLKKFRSISAKAVAKQVVNNSLKIKSGINYFDFKDFQPWR